MEESHSLARNTALDCCVSVKKISTVLKPVCILGVYLCKCVELAFWGLFVTTAKPSLP